MADTASSQEFREGILLVLSAASGTGKTSLAHELIARVANLHLSTSCTTRPQRQGEQPDKDYIFLSLDDFILRRDQGHFLEWASISGNFYGTPIENINSSLQKGQDILLEIDWQGAARVRKLYPQAITIFILPPDIKQLEQRLINRRQDSEGEIRRRLANAREEISHFHEFDYLLVNDTFALALESLIAIVTATRVQTKRQRLLLHKKIKSLLA